MFKQKIGVAILALLVALIVFTACGIVQAVDVVNLSPLGNKDGGKSETAIGDLVADAVRAAMRAEIAFIASSELKAKDPAFIAGKVSSSDIAGLVSYPNDSLTLLFIKGATIKQALEKSLSIYPQPNLGFLQVSGISFNFDPKKSAGSRITSIMVGNRVIDDAAYYNVAVTSSMANGALGYWKIWTKNDIKRKSADITVASALESYLTANQRIDYSSLDRITEAR